MGWLRPLGVPDKGTGRAEGAALVNFATTNGAVSAIQTRGFLKPPPLPFSGGEDAGAYSEHVPHS